MKIQTGKKITIIQPNTSKDPLTHCLDKMKYYNPLMTYELEIASEMYEHRGLPCFDVIGDSGSKNQGLEPNTRRTYLVDIGICPIEERKHLECEGITRAFDDQLKADAYIERLMAKDMVFRTFSIALEMWGFNTEPHNVIYFMEQNQKNLTNNSPAKPFKVDA